MLFHSSIRNELARSFGATLVVLVTVVMTMMLIRVLFLANRGRVNPTDVLLIMVNPIHIEQVPQTRSMHCNDDATSNVAMPTSTRDAPLAT